MQWIEQGDPAVDARKLALARQAVALNPKNLRCWHALLKSLQQAGEFDEACRCADAALARFPDDTDLQLQCARALMDSGRFEAALEIVGRVLTKGGACESPRRLRYRLLMLLGQPSAAAAVGHGLAGDEPRFAEADARAFFSSDRLAELVALCDAHLAGQSGHTSAIYWKAVALARAGRDEEARAVLRLDRFVEVTTVPAPSGYADAVGFRAALTDEIARNPTLVGDPPGKATRQGLQTRRLRRADTPAIEALLVLLKTAIDDYVRRLPGTTDGFVRACPHAASLSAWAVITGADGHQTSHHHGGGWLSGVYYVEASRAPGDEHYAGALVLGGIDKGEAPWGTREIEPVPGRVVLFPSYVPHATRPPGIAGRRTIVAFDVVPEPAAEAGAA
ncbi:MAG TPA: putative 2OG-Fe(II) oxygenase [Pseudolabrys sp.]